MNKSIKVTGAENSKHMALAFRAVEDFRESGFGKYINSEGKSAGMLITFGVKRFFKNIPTHDLFIYESTDEYIVTIEPHKIEGLKG